MVSTTVNIGVNYGVSSTNIDLVDVNGDGLPDQVMVDPQPGTANSGTMTVRLNLGYSFGPPQTWNNPAWPVDLQSLGVLNDISSVLGGNVGPNGTSFQDTGSDSAAIGATAGNFGGGVGDVETTNRTLAQTLDVNGDGLPDQVLKASGSNQLLVKLNSGTGFGPAQPWDLSGAWLDPLNPGSTLTVNPSASFLYPASYAFLQSADTASFSVVQGWQASLSFEICFFLCVGASGFTSGNGGYSQMEFTDIDGDGLPDHVLKLNGDANVYAKLNQIADTNLLETVTGTLGDTIQLGYSRVGNVVNPSVGVDMPSNHWALTSVRTGDGRENFYTDHISYDLFMPTNASNAAVPSGFYDRVEREDYGFGHVEITRGQLVGGVWQEGDGSQVERFFYNQDFYRKGRLQAEFEADENGNLIRGRRVDMPAPSGITPRTGSYFPPTEDAYTLTYEKSASTSLIPTELAASAGGGAPAAPKYRHEFRKYDPHGNLTLMVDYGDPQLTASEVDYNITYTPFDPNQNITRATDIQASAGPGGVLLRHRTATYVPNKGVLQTLTNVVTGGVNPSTGAAYSNSPSTTSFVYDGLGNLHGVTDPNNYTLTYSYDSLMQIYKSGASDSFGYSSSSTPNYNFGGEANSTDVNGQKENFVYDQFGRLIQVFGPDDQGATVPTIGMSYNTTFPASAITQHKDIQHAGDPIQTVTFMDGLRRVIQTKKDLDRDSNGNGTVVTGMTVSGQVTFDNRGRVQAQGAADL